MSADFGGILSRYIFSFIAIVFGFECAALPQNNVGQLRLQSSEYVSSGQNYYRDGAEDNNNSLSLGIEQEGKWRRFGARMSLKDEYSATENWNYFKVYDLHADYRIDPRLQLAVGRKLDRWNEWEEDFGQSLFQPRYMQNRLRPEFAGLTGVFFNTNTRPFAFTIGVLPVHIPDMGAHVSVKDNKFVSKNPWFKPPAGEFQFRQGIGDIHYSLEKPEVTEVLFNPGAVAKVEFNDSAKYFGRLSVAYKPMPQFLLGFPSENRVQVAAIGDHMDLRVTPRVPYHAVASHDSVMRSEGWTVQASVAAEYPMREEAPADYTAQTAKPAGIYALGVSRPLEDEGLYAARARVGFLRVDGGDGNDTGNFASERTLFENRYQYTEAYLLGVYKPWRGFGRFPLDSELKIIYDRIQHGGAVGIYLGMNISDEFRADIEADFLGLLAGPRRQDDGFLSLYRANDRVGIGLSYVY